MRRRHRIPRLTRKKLTTLLLGIILAVYYALYGGDDKTLQGIVTHVVDGDTIDVTVVGEVRRVRLLGVDTPETVHPNKPVQPYGREASAFTKKSLLNRHVWLEYDVAPLDKYNRHLAYIWLEAPEYGESAIKRNMFNARLLLEGYAKIMTIQPNSRYSDLFLKFEREARDGGKGLWKRKK